VRKVELMGIWNYNTIIKSELEETEKCILSALKTRQRVLSSAITELLESGGKRLRPALLLLSAKFGDFDKDKLIPLAASIEILHMATLVHDDIIDDSKFRRGSPTVQSKWGKDTAVFAGDFLFTRAFSLITQKTSFENLQRLAGVIKSICEGEIDQFYHRFNLNTTVMQYIKRIGRKTALLFALSCRIGAMESGCNSMIQRSLWNYGFNLGMAFQITDDLLDFNGNPDIVGKPVMSDFASGVFTLPVIYTINQKNYRQKIEDILGRNTFTLEELMQVKKWTEESGGMEYTRELNRRYLIRAHKSLENLPDISAKSSLEQLIKVVAERQY